MNEEKESKERALFETGFEVIVQGTLDMVLELMASLAKELSEESTSKVHGEKYGIRRTSGAPDYAHWDKTYRASCIVYVTFEEVASSPTVDVGKVSLLLLPNDRTLFKVEPSEWNPRFTNFINRLFAEFQQLGFVDFREERPPLGFRLPHQVKHD